MQLVQCPHCQRQFKVPKPVTNAKMKCSRCAQVFVGSSFESASPAGAPAPYGVAPPAVRPVGSPQQPQPPPRARGGNLVFVVVSIVLGLAVIPVLIYAVYTYNHPKFKVKDAQTGQIISEQKSDKQAIERAVAEETARRQEVRRHEADFYAGKNAGGADKPAAGGQAPRGPFRDPSGLMGDEKIPAQPAPGRAAPANPGGAAGNTGAAAAPRSAIPASDPKIEPSAPRVDTIAGGDEIFISGRMTNRYGVALSKIAVTLYVRGQPAGTQTYPYVSADGYVQYSFARNDLNLTEGDVALVAKGEPAPGDLVIWQVPSGDIQRGRTDGDKNIWVGRAFNATGVPVKELQLYFDIFDDKGIACGKGGQGKFQDASALGVGKSASFEIATQDFITQHGNTIVARVVAKKY